MPSVFDRLRTIVANIFTWRNSVLSNDSTVVWHATSDTSEAKLKNRRIILSKHSRSLKLNGKDLGNLTEENVAAILECHPNCKDVLTATVTDLLTLTAVPVFIGRFGNLTSLDLSKNGLTHLPWSIVYLRKLENLNLSLNKFTFLPPLIGHLPSLEKMNLAYNCLLSLPTDLIHLKKLSVLNVEGNNGLMSPSLEVCKSGLDVILAHLQKRRGRTNVWRNSTGKYSTEMPQTQSETEVKSLLELCVATVLRFQIDYFSMVNVPPALKRHLRNRSQANWDTIKVAKCSRCGKCFSSEAYFDGHACV